MPIAARGSVPARSNRFLLDATMFFSPSKPLGSILDLVMGALAKRVMGGPLGFAQNVRLQIWSCGVFLLLLTVIILRPNSAWAGSRSCEGPESCCPAKVADDLGSHVDVTLGVVLLGLYNVNEKAGTWDADFYLNEVWSPAPNFTPQTEIVNEVSRQAEQFDTTELHQGKCVRFRRIRSTLHSAYNLRTFPFDRQRLTLQFSDADFPAQQLSYTAKPASVELDELARERLSSWKLDGAMTYEQAVRVYKGEVGAPEYDYATFSVPVRRHVSFHVAKFFMPLLIIVIVAFSVFWMPPDDLNSRASVGVTCLLAAIALQFAEAGNLPEVAYLTLADRGYIISYFGLALAMIASIYSNVLARRDQKIRASHFDRRMRIVFPSVFLLALLLGVIRAYTQTGA
ncbi:MAG: hypothetical protein U0359_10860 [Byssovorax sp.]